MINIAQAIIAVMKEVKGIDKSMTVGSGQNSYKGVSDKDVKNIIGAAMEKNGLAIVPTSVDAKTTVDRWEETNQYGTKMKQSVLVETTTKYLLLHKSGESIELAGYGHGVDSQDKAAGKATTYSLKNCLLYTFMVPTGTIDDTDTIHSDSIEVPQAAAPKPPVHPELLPGTEKWLVCKNAVSDGIATIEKIRLKNTLSEDNAALLLKEAKIAQQEKEQQTNFTTA